MFSKVFLKKQTFASLQIAGTPASFECEFLNRVLQPSSCLCCVVVTVETAEILILSSYDFF